MYKSITINTRSSFWTNKEGQEELLVDAEDLNQEMDNVINKMTNDGYELKQITPINSGNMNNGTGYFGTTSLILTFFMA